jgi:hypothetical protein
MKLPKTKPISIIFAVLTISLGLSAQENSSKTPSQYHFREFSKGTIRFKNGSTRDIVLNYNLLSENMVFQQNDKFLDLMNTESIDTVYLQSKKFIPSDKMFLEVVCSGKIPLFIEYKADIEMPGKPAGYGSTSQTSATDVISTLHTGTGAFNLKLPDEYTVKPFLINWVLVNGKMNNFINERQFLKIFGDKQVVIKKFIKDNKIKIEKRDDLIRLVGFCQDNI